MEMISIIRKIYSCLGDELSKECFKASLLYAMTEDYAEICHMVSHTCPGALLRNKLKEHPGAPFFIWGAGFWGEKVKQSLPDIGWQGFVDSSPKEKVKQGLPVLCPEEFLRVNGDAVVVISSADWHVEILRQLAEYGFPMERVIDMGEMVLDAFDRQYFDLPYLPHIEDEVFVDAGCYDGGSVRNFIKWCGGKYREIFAFEPDVQCYKKCREALMDVPGLHLESRGLWESESKLFFSAKGDSTSKILESGSECIETVRLDDVVGDKKVSFIKMDIEGAEREALLGSADTIRRCHPKLAICVYHKPQDIWEIPALILDLNPDYRLYIRHYSLYAPDTVLYAI